MPNKEIKFLRFNKIDKFVVKIENEIDTITNATVQAVKLFEVKYIYILIFYLGNNLIITRAEIVIPAMKKIIKKKIKILKVKIITIIINIIMEKKIV
jgi:hypothetical protein